MWKKLEWIKAWKLWWTLPPGACSNYRLVPYWRFVFKAAPLVWALAQRSGGIEDHQGDLASGREVTGEFTGCENEPHAVAGLLQEGVVHLCPAESCPLHTDAPVLHATRVRIWSSSRFQADYLTKIGKQILENAVAAEKKAANKPRTKAPRPKKDVNKPASPRERGGDRGRGLAPAVPLPVLSDGEEAGDEEGKTGPLSGANPAHLRDLLRSTTEKILEAASAQRGGRRRAAAGSGPSCRWLRPCSGYLGPGGWEQSQPSEGDSFPCGGLGGFKRRQYEALGEKDEWIGRCSVTVAGSGGAIDAGRKAQKEAEEGEGQERSA